MGPAALKQAGSAGGSGGGWAARGRKGKGGAAVSQWCSIDHLVEASCITVLPATHQLPPRCVTVRAGQEAEEGLGDWLGRFREGRLRGINDALSCLLAFNTAREWAQVFPACSPCPHLQLHCTCNVVLQNAHESIRRSEHVYTQRVRMATRKSEQVYIQE